MVSSRLRSTLLFPWESQAGIRRFLRMGRARPVLVIVGLLLFLMLVGSRERRQSGIRQTRATLLGLHRAVDAYLAEHDGSCPTQLSDVLDFSRFKEVPRDAWGNPLRLLCPARREGERYELLSDGPDGKPFGLDRIQ